MSFFTLGNASIPPNCSGNLTMTRIADLMATIDALRFYAFDCPICVKEVNADEAELIVVAAQENMVRNIAVVRQIADVTVQDLDTFWGGVKLFEFIDPLFGDVLMGLSSMDGSRVYISRKLITRSDQLACQQALEFEYATSLSRWRKTGPFLVSSCIDPNLRAADSRDAVLGAGHFYEERVHKRREIIPTPFDLNWNAFHRR